MLKSKLTCLQMCRSAVRPLHADTVLLLHWLPASAPADGAAWGTLLVTTNFLLSNFLAKLTAASAAARLPANLQHGAAHPDFGASAPLAEVLTIAEKLLPTLHMVLTAAHKAYGKLLEGELVTDEHAWDAFTDEGDVRFLQRQS